MWFNDVGVAEGREVASGDVPALGSHTIDPSDQPQPENVGQPGSGAAIANNAPPGKSVSKKRSKAGKMGRPAPAPPTDAELSAVFSMLNPKGMSAIIGSDIKQVLALDWLITFVHGAGWAKNAAIGNGSLLNVIKHAWVFAFGRTTWPCPCLTIHHTKPTT